MLEVSGVAVCVCVCLADICVIIHLLKGSTKSYARNGYQLNRFPSCLPGGCRQHRHGYSRSGVVILFT